MSVLAIIVIVVVVLAILFAVFTFVPQARRKAQERKRERELGKRRDQMISQERSEAEAGIRRAEQAEQRARVERAEAQLRQERATLHERGMADHELVDGDEAQTERQQAGAYREER